MVQTAPKMLFMVVTAIPVLREKYISSFLTVSAMYDITNTACNS